MQLPSVTPSVFSRPENLLLVLVPTAPYCSLLLPAASHCSPLLPTASYCSLLLPTAPSSLSTDTHVVLSHTLFTPSLSHTHTSCSRA
jgi:hypothetical protein